MGIRKQKFLKASLARASSQTGVFRVVSQLEARRCRVCVGEEMPYEKAWLKISVLKLPRKIQEEVLSFY